MVLVQSNDAPDIIQAITLIINCINEEHEGYTNREGALTFKLVVPELSAGMLIGHGGDNIKKIYTDTGSQVKINLHKREIQGLHERVLSLTGKENDFVYVYSAAWWFNRYCSLNSFVAHFLFLSSMCLIHTLNTSTFDTYM